MQPISLTAFAPSYDSTQLHPDFRRAISSRIAHLVSARGTTWLFAEIHVEVLVDLEATVVRVTVNLQQRRARFGDIGIELVIPGTQERVRHIEALAVQTQLQHLWATLQLVPLHRATLAQQPAEP